jgi:hypothetical protein
MKATYKTGKDPFRYRCSLRMRVNRYTRTTTTFPNPPVSRRIGKELRESLRQRHRARRLFVLRKFKKLSWLTGLGMVSLKPVSLSMGEFQ